MYYFIIFKIYYIILNSINIEEFYNTTTDELSKMVNYTASNKEYVFTNIINKIIKSFYDKKYFLTKYQMLNNIPFTFKDEQLKNDIINKYYYYDNFKDVNYKQKIQHKFNIELKSEHYLFKLFV